MYITNSWWYIFKHISLAKKTRERGISCSNTRCLVKYSLLALSFRPRYFYMTIGRLRSCIMEREKERELLRETRKPVIFQWEIASVSDTRAARNSTFLLFLPLSFLFFFSFSSLRSLRASGLLHPVLIFSSFLLFFALYLRVARTRTAYQFFYTRTRSPRPLYSAE